MHLSPLRNSITSITTDLWRKICIVTKQNALFKEILNFLIDLRSVQINLHKGVRTCVLTPPILLGVQTSNLARLIIIWERVP